jgi:hypothetical protein
MLKFTQSDAVPRNLRLTFEITIRAQNGPVRGGGVRLSGDS